MGKTDNRDKDVKPNLSVEYEITVRDKNGKVIEHRREESKSLVKNFLLLLNAAFKLDYSSVVDTGGTARNASARCYWHVSWCNGGGGYTVTYYTGWTVLAGEGDDTFGIVVGTGDTPVTADDYNLESKIAHGTGAGQLSYGAVTLYDPVVVDANKVKQQIIRSFTNNSGADITVKEIGLIVKTSHDNYLVMVIRDIITATTVPDGGTLDLSLFITTTA